MVWVPSLMNQREKVNRLTTDLIVDEVWERLGPTARKAMWSNVVANAPAYNLPSLPGNSLVKGARQPLRYFPILPLLAI